MYLFLFVMFALLLSGWCAYAHVEYRKMYFAVCLPMSIAALALFLMQVPLGAGNVLSPYLWGILLVIGFWTLRTQVHRILA